MPKPSRLDDPIYACLAWRRYWRLMRWMMLLTLACVLLALGILYYVVGFASVHFYIAMAGGVFFTLMLTAGLMGLVFLSSGTGHDESIDDPISGEIYPDE